MSSTLLSEEPYLLSPSTATQSVKTESSPSPDLLPASVRPYQFYPQFPSQSSLQNRHNLRPPQPAYRFNGLSNMPPTQQWPHASSNGSISLQNAMPFSDDYDDITEVADGLNGLGQSSGSTSGEKAVRRRSSKGQFLLLFLLFKFLKAIGSLRSMQKVEM